MQSDKAMIGWDYVVRFIIGLMLLLILIYIVFKTQSSEMTFFDQMTRMFT